MTSKRSWQAVRSDFRNMLYLVWKGFVPKSPTPTDLQYDMADYMANGPKRSAVKGFRGIAKSYAASAYAIWELDRNPDLNVLVFSASKPRSDAFTTFCLRIINEMPELAHLRPREDQRSSSIAFDVGPARAAQTPSLYSVGVFGNATGFRGDLIIPDDIEVRNNSETVTQREKLLSRIVEYEALLKPDSVLNKILFLGTDQSDESIYRELPRRGYSVRVWPVRYPSCAKAARWATLYAPMIVEAVTRNPSLEGLTTEPDRFSEEELVKRELSMGRREFARQYLLDPEMEGGETTPLQQKDLIVHALDRDMAPEKLIWNNSPDQVLEVAENVGFTGDRFYRGLVMPDCRFAPYQGTMMYIDPAGRGKDETAYVIMSALHGMLFLRDAMGLKGYDSPTLTKIAEACRDFKVNTVVIEPNFGDGMFKTLLGPVMAGIHPCSLVDDERSQAQKERRICDTLEPVITGHRLVIDERLVRDDYYSVKEYPQDEAFHYRLWYQFTHISRLKGCLKHDDRVDALAGAVAYWQKALGRNVDQAVAASRDKARDEALKKFIAGVRGTSPAKHMNVIGGRL